MDENNYVFPFGNVNNNRAGCTRKRSFTVKKFEVINDVKHAQGECYFTVWLSELDDIRTVRYIYIIGRKKG